MPIATALQRLLLGVDLLDRKVNGMLGYPPGNLRNRGLQDWRVSGTQWVKFFINAGLNPDARVLDLGCGAGRLVMLLRQLS